jgi:hypothetical protein
LSRALRGHQVVEVDHRAITMVAKTGSQLRVYRGAVDPGVVLAWEIGPDVLQFGNQIREPPSICRSI